MVLRKLAKRVRPIVPKGPALAIASSMKKMGTKEIRRKPHHATSSGALIKSGGSAKANVLNAMVQMRPSKKLIQLPARSDRKLRFATSSNQQG